MKLTTMIIGIIIALSIVSSTIPTLVEFAIAKPGDASQDPKGKPSDPNFWGEVIKEQATTDDGNPGIGEHASDPVPGDEDRETPRGGVGNQEGDGPSGHGAIVACQDDNPETECRN